MESDPLKNIYTYIENSGLTSRPIKMKTVQNSMKNLTAIHNLIFEILDRTFDSDKKTDENIKRTLIKEIGVFDNFQVDYIWKNQEKIIAPFRRVNKMRKLTEKYGKTMMYLNNSFIGGGSEPEVEDTEGADDVPTKIEDTEGAKEVRSKTLRIQSVLDMVKYVVNIDEKDQEDLFRKLLGMKLVEESEIEPLLSKIRSFKGLTDVEIIAEIDGELLKKFERLNGNCNMNFSKLFQNFEKMQAPFHIKHLRKIMETICVPFSFVELVDKINLPDMSSIPKIDLNKVIDKIEGLSGFGLPDTSMFFPEGVTKWDWIFFPLWSIEQIPKYGVFAGIPMDFASVIVAQIDILMAFLVPVLLNAKMPIITLISNVIGVITAGVGLAAAPIYLPILHKIIDFIIHLISHISTIINMFIHLSRKNLGLAFILLTDIIPSIGGISDTFVNLSVILNKNLERTQKLSEMYIDFINMQINSADALGDRLQCLNEKIINFKRRINDQVMQIFKYTDGFYCKREDGSPCQKTLEPKPSNKKPKNKSDKKETSSTKKDDKNKGTIVEKDDKGKNK